MGEGMNAAVARVIGGIEKGERLQREHERRQRLNAHASAILQAAKAMLSAFGGDVPDWLRPEWEALAKACADAEGFPKE